MKPKQCSECQREADFILEDGFGQVVQLCDQHYSHDKGEPCQETDCQECCQHDDLKCGHCLDCDKIFFGE